MTTIARGPKPVAVLKEFGLEPTVRVPEPNTWREVLATIDLCVPVAQQNVGLLEYGRPNASLVAGLEARGARVEAVRVYRWDLPEDIAPLADNLRAIAAGQRQVALFTSSHQVVNLLRVAEELGLTEAAARVAGADGHRLDRADHQRNPARARSAGRSRARAQQDGPARGPGRRALARGAGRQAVEPRSASAPRLAARAPATRPRAEIVPPASSAAAPAGPAFDSLFLRACRRQPVERTPIWLMRQAGRYMSEYREVRRQTTFLEPCARIRSFAPR